MARYSYPTIKVSGMGSLKIYGLDYSAPTVDSVGRMTVTYVDKLNNLNSPKLTTKTASIISIGGISFKGYPTKSSKILSASGESLLEVSYSDGSFILDKYFVGLKGKHANSNTPFNTTYGPSKITDEGLIYNSLRSYVKYKGKSSGIDLSNTPKWMILVGSSIDPCGNDFTADSSQDVCNPCPESSNSHAQNSIDVDCEKKRSLNIFEVDYSFGELLSELANRSLKVSINGNYNTEYRASFSGSLRDVLKSWCSIFGFSFYYDNDKIIIYDLKTGITSLPTLSESVIFSKKEDRSIEHTQTTAGVLYYSQPGVEREYGCSSDYGKKILCRPLTVKDLGVGAIMDDYGATSKNSFYDLIEYLCTFSGYSPVLREMMAWYEVYGIRSAEIAKSLVSTSKTSTTLGGVKYGNYLNSNFGSDKKGSYTLPLLSMTLKAVYDKDSAEFKDLMAGNSLDDSIKKKILDNDKYKPYFFVASQNEARFANMINWEDSIATGFLGKYFIRYYENYSSSSPTIQACQNDQATFYKQGSSSLDFSNFMPIVNSESSPEFGFDPSKYKRAANYTSLPIYKFNSKQGTVKDSFILVERGVRWTPPIGEGGPINKILKAAEPFRLINLGSVSTYGIFLDQHANNKDQPFTDGDSLFVGFEMPSGFNTSVSEVNHPEESILGKRCEIYLSAFSTPLDLGLKSKRCKRIDLGSVGAIYMPPQANYNNTEDGGYGVYVSHERSIDYKKVIPKIEMVVSNFIDDADVMSNTINYKESINLSSVNPVEYIKNGDGTENCLPNHSGIKQRMEELSKNIASSSIGESRTITYEIGGLPSLGYSIKNGLVSFSVRVGSKGVSSTLVFSDLKERVIDIGETLKETEMIKNLPIANSHNSIRIGQNLLSRSVENNTLQL